MTTLVFEHNIVDTKFGELTRVEFETQELDVFEFLGYFIRFALAAGYQIESIKDAIISMSYEYEEVNNKEQL